MTETILSSTALILAVLALRLLLKNKISARLRYGLWLLVLLRLLLPVSFGESAVSVMNVAERVERKTLEAASSGTFTADIQLPVGDAAQLDAQAVQPEHTAPSEVPAGKDAAPAAQNPGVSVGQIVKTVWLAVAAATGAVMLASNLWFSHRLRVSRRPCPDLRCGLPVYRSDAIPTPCLFGLLRPAIYVTGQALEDETALRHVLAHEQTHYRHLDHIWSLLRCVCVALHWYNPLVWLAAYLSKEDAELACDEAAILRIGEGERIAYGKTLLLFTCAGSGTNLLWTATTMQCSQKSLKERVTRIAKKQHAAAYTTVAALALAVVAACCTFTGAKTLEPVPVEDQEEEESRLAEEAVEPEAVLPVEEETPPVMPEGMTEEETVAWLQANAGLPEGFQYVTGWGSHWLLQHYSQEGTELRLIDGATGETLDTQWAEMDMDPPGPEEIPPEDEAALDMYYTYTNQYLTLGYYAGDLVWGEAGLYQYRDGSLTRLYDGGVCAVAQAEDGLWIVAREPGKRVAYTTAGINCSAGDQIVWIGSDGTASLAADASGLGLCLTGVFQEDGTLYAETTESWGMADLHTYLYRVEEGRLIACTTAGGNGYAERSEAEAAQEQARLDALYAERT